MEFKYAVKQFIYSCADDLNNLSNEIYKVELRQKDLEKTSQMERVLHFAKFKQKKVAIQEMLAELNAKKDSLEREQQMYMMFGEEFPPESMLSEREKELILARQQKLWIIEQVDLGLM